MKVFKPGQKVRDVRYTRRPGGVIREVCLAGVHVDMVFEDGHKGLCWYYMRTAQQELDIIEEEE